MSTPPNVDYAAWATLAKAQAVEQRMDQLSAAETPKSWVLVGTWANGWGNYSGRSVAVKLTDQGTAVRISGQFSGGTQTDGTGVFWVGSPYQPGRLESIPIGSSGASGIVYIARCPYLEFGTDGWVHIWGCADSGTGGHFIINGTYPLDTY
jgi:hypothetical protein